MKKKKYPFLDQSLKDIKGEKWKDIPGFEGYQISSFSRVKSLERWIDRGHYDYLRPERIIKLRCAGKSKRKPDALWLQMKLHKEKKRYNFSVARYVYFLFVSPFDLEDHSIVITMKDGDPLSSHYKNLLLRSISDIAKEGFAKGERRTSFQDQIKRVTQYSPDGKKIKTYSSSKQASEATGVPAGYINGSAITKTRMAGGYYWRYEAPKREINTRGLVLSRPDEPIKKKSDTHYYTIRSIDDLPGEKWKAIDGFEGLYEVSSYGRVKSLQKLKEVITHKGNKTRFWTKAFIMKQIVGSSYNHYLGKPSYHLAIRLKKEAVNAMTYVVSRLVYQAFGENKRAMAEKMVIHTDGDNLHNHIANLALATQTEVYKKAFAAKRRVSHFATISAKQRRAYALKTAKTLRKPVTQYNVRGKRIASFESTLAAAKATGLHNSTICNTIKGRLRTAGGFIWKRK